MIEQQVYIWILAARQTGANDVIAGLAPGMPFHVSVFDAASSAEDTSLAAPSQTRAAILVLDREASENCLMLQAVKWCVQEMTRRDTFRMFVWLANLSIREQRKLVEPRGLLDPVHMVEGLTAAQVASQASYFVAHWDELRFMVLSRTAQLWTDTLLSVVASVILAVAALAV